MKRIGILANCEKKNAEEVLKRLVRKADALSLKLVSAPPTSQFLPEAEKRLSEAELSQDVDVVLVLGGDGSMLHAMRAMSRQHVPMMGVNLGSLGFMTSVSQDHLEHALETLAEDTYKTSTRTAACCTIIRRDGSQQQHRALNDMVLGWGATSRIIGLDVQINDEPVSSYRCDGIILSTPTGSTGHSLSAGGPIIHPEARVLLMNVLCPHTLGARPIVVPDENVITVTAVEISEGKRLMLSIDGQTEEPFEEGDRLVIQKDSQDTRFLHLPDYSYYSVLRQKLHLRGGNV